MAEEEAEVTGLKAQIEQLTRERALLESFMEAHDGLTRMVLDGHDIGAITNRLSHLLRTSVEVQDRYAVRLAAFTFENIHDEQHNGSGDTEAYLQTYLKQARASRQLVQMPANPQCGLTRARLVAPIMVEQDLLGYVLVLERRGSFSQRVQRATEHAALIFALLMMKQKSQAETERRLQASFLADLLSGNFSDEGSILNRGRYLGFNPSVIYQLVLVAPDNVADLLPQEMVREQLLGELAHTLTSSWPGSLYLAQGANLLALLPPAPPTLTTERLAAQLRQTASRFAPGLSLTLALGGACQHPADFARAASRAERSLELARLLGYSGGVIDYAALGVYNVLFERENKQLLFDFAQGQLQALLDYDAHHKTELVATLQKYFQNSTRLKETAHAASIHLSALKYRLRRIQEIGGFDLGDAETAFNLQLALKIVGVQSVFGV